MALAVGAVVAGVGCIAAAATYMRDEKNNTASSAWTYIDNAGRASLTTLGVILMFWIAPYAAEAVTMEVTQGLPLTVLFGKVVTFEGLAEWALIGTEGAALVNAFFQTNELLMFFGDTKELGAPTGCDEYDELKGMTEAECMQLFLLGLPYWLEERERTAKQEWKIEVQEKGDKGNVRFSEMSESEIAKIVEEYRAKAPIEIPDTAKWKATSKAGGYE